MEDNQDKLVNCRQCKYFPVSWVPKMPMTCNLHGFKSARLPSMVVYRTSGVPCQGFTQKEKKLKPSGGNDHQ